MMTIVNRITRTWALAIERVYDYVLFESPLRMPILNGSAWVTRLFQEVVFRSPFKKAFLTRYFYQYGPQQLCFICQCIEETKHVVGSVAEIGCERGFTTVFLCHFLDDLRVRKDYIALDTFAGFVPDDVAHEVKCRKKTDTMYVGFQINKKKWFDAALQQRKIRRVRSIQADVNRLDLRTIGPLSFVLLDVDLYRPTLKALPELYSVLSPGGIILVDDCNPNSPYWDGAYYAYTEFMRELGQSPSIVCVKLGVIRKLACVPISEPRRL